MKKRALMSWILVGAFLSMGLVFASPGTGFARSPAYCSGYARDYANSYSNSGGTVLGGAAGGAALGALFGAMTGSPGTGAGIGAGVGALGGGVASANNWHALYDRAYYRCMEGYRLY